MYPNLYYAFKDIFGAEVPALRFVNSFGFFVALAFLAAAYVLTRELTIKERAGLMYARETRVVVGKPAGLMELLGNFILGFLLGYKIVGLFLVDRPAGSDPQEFIFSADGHLPAGLILGILFAGIKWWEKNKQKLPKPEERVIRIWPHDRVGDMVIFAAVFGFLGAKIFHNLENWNEFWRNPIEALLSFSGLTFYGGLICAGVAIYFYARKHGMGFRHLADSIAPALLLAYAVGRIGCQVSGDGDWGIPNSAYLSTPEGNVVPAPAGAFHQAVTSNSALYMTDSSIRSADDVQHSAVTAPSWLPRWMVAYNYPNNVINEGVPLKGCEGQYCQQLPVPVFPTPFYETVAGLLLTGVLFGLRRRLTVPGTLFAVYLILNGLERFFIEKIRVNSQYHIMGMNPTQAELISMGLIIAGVIMFLYLVTERRRGRTRAEANV